MRGNNARFTRWRCYQTDPTEMTPIKEDPPTIQCHCVLKGALFIRQPASMIAIPLTNGGTVSQHVGQPDAPRRLVVELGEMPGD